MKIPGHTAPWLLRPRVLFVVSFLAFGLVATVVFAYWKYSKTEDLGTKIDFAAKSAFGSAAVVSLLVGYQTLRLNIHQRQIDAAFQLLARYDREDERMARRKMEALMLRTGRLDEYADDAIPPERVAGFMAAIRSDPELDEAAVMVLGYFEDVALALKSGYASEAVVFRSIQPTAVKLIAALRPYVVDFRVSEKNDIYYEDALALRERWRLGLSVRTSSAELRRFVRSAARR